MTKLIAPDGTSYSPEEFSNIQEVSTFDKVKNFVNNNIVPNNYGEEAMGLSALYRASSGRNPEEISRIIGSSSELGLEAQSMLNSPKELVSEAEQAANAKRNEPEDWNTFVQEYPKTAQYLNNGKNMALSHDDINLLSETERTIKNTVRMGELAKRRSQLGLKLQGMNGDLSGLSDDERQEVYSLTKEMKTLQSQLPQTTWSIQGLLSGLVGMAEPAVQGVKGAAAGAALGAGAGAVTLGGVGAIPGAVAGAGLGFRLGMSDEFAANAMGNAYLDNLIANADHPMAGALATGAATFGLGFVQAGKWMNIPKELGLKHIGLTAVEQALMGAGFSAADITGKKIANSDASISGEDISNIAKGGIEMVPIGLAMSFPSYGVAGLRRIGEIADNSKTAGRNPDLFADKVNNDVAGTPLQDTAINGEGLSVYLNSVKPEDAEKIMARLEITPDDLAEAVATGGEVPIKAGNLSVLDNATREALLPDIRVGNELSEREFLAKKQEFEEAMKQKETEVGTEEPQRTIAEDLGITKDLADKEKTDLEKSLSEHENETNVIEQNKEYQSRMDEAKKEVEAQIESDPYHQAYQMLGFDLQMFASKDVKEIAQKYKDGKLTEEQKAKFEDIAEGNKIDSNKLADEITKGRTKDSDLKQRLSNASKAIKEEIIGTKEDVSDRSQASDNLLKKSALEAATLRGMASGEHRADNRAKREAEITARWKDAEAKLIKQIDDAKNAGKIEQLKNKFTGKVEELQNKLKEAKSKYEEEIKALKNEHKQENKDRKATEQHDSKMAREWLKSEQISQRLARQAEIGIKAAQKMAQDIINSKTITELRHMGAADWKNYVRLARQAASNAEHSYRKGRYEEAAKFKTQELINRALAQEAMKAQKQLQKIDSGLKKFINRGQSLLGMPVEFVSQIDKLLKEYGLSDREPVALPGTKPMGLLEFLKKMENEYHVVPIPDFVRMLQPKDSNFLTLQQYADVAKAIKTIAAMGKKYDKFLSLFDKTTINEAAKLAMATIEKNAGIKYAADMEPGSQYKNKLREKMAKSVRLIDWVIPSQVNVLTLCKFFDGGDTGPMHDYLYNLLAQAETNKIDRKERAMKDVTSLFDKYYGKTKEAVKQRSERIFFDHLGRYFTKEEILMVGMNWGNEGNRDRIMRGFGWMKPDGTYDMAKVQPILDKLGKKEWDFCQSVWDYLETYWPDIKTLEMEVAGVEPEQVKPARVDTKDGSYKGGYFPIAYDYGKSAEAYKTMEQKNALYKQFPASHAMTEHGHTEARANQNDVPIKLSMDVFFSHLDNVIHDLAYRKAVIDANRFLNSPDVQAAVTNALGMDAHRMMNDWLKSIAGDQGDYSKPGERIANWFRYKATFAGMGLRIALFPIDALGNLSNGIWEVGLPKMVSAIKDYAFSPKNSHDIVVENSAFMRNRTMIRERDLWDVANKWYKGNQGLTNFAFATMAWSDQLISFPLWTEMYKTKIGEGMTKEQAVLFADNKVKQTIGSGSILDQVGAQRGSAYKKLMSMYFSWASMMFNRMWLNAKQSGVQTDMGNYGSAVGIMAKSIFFGFIAQGLIDGVIREYERNEENPDPDKQFGRVTSRFLSQPLSYWWLGRDVGQLAISQIFHQYNDYKMSPVETNVEQIVKGGTAVIDLVKDDINTLKDAEKIAKGVSSTGLYPQQMNTWAFNFLDWIGDNGEAHWQDIMTRRVKKK